MRKLRTTSVQQILHPPTPADGEGRRVQEYAARSRLWTRYFLLRNSRKNNASLRENLNFEARLDLNGMLRRVCGNGFFRCFLKTKIQKRRQSMPIIVSAWTQFAKYPPTPADIKGWACQGLQVCSSMHKQQRKQETVPLPPFKSNKHKHKQEDVLHPNPRSTSNKHKRIVFPKTTKQERRQKNLKS